MHDDTYELILKIPQELHDKIFKIDDLLKLKPEHQKKIKMCMCANPILQYREEILEYIFKNGFNSLLNFSLNHEDILSKSEKIDDTIKIIHNFISIFNKTEEIFIIDNYILTKDSPWDIFYKIIEPIKDTLQKITFITYCIDDSTKQFFIYELSKLDIKCQIYCSNQFHDRFWIDTNNEIGIVIGTSLNGINKKIALIDRLGYADVRYIKSIIENIKSNQI